MSENAHSENYQKVYDYYHATPQLWSINRVWNAVNKWITVSEYKDITGIDYPYKSLEEQENAK